MKFLLVFLLILSTNANSTQDVEDPEQLLNFLRLFLSDPLVAENIHNYAAKGCNWKSEIIWSGGAENINNDTLRYGGGFTINYLSRSGREIPLRFSYTMLSQSGARMLEKISRRKDSASLPDCS